MILWLKDCLVTKKNASRNGKVNLTKTEIVFIVVHLKSGRLYLTVVQRFKVAFVREIWLLIRETGRFTLYLGDSRIIRESWHVWYYTICVHKCWMGIHSLPVLLHHGPTLLDHHSMQLPMLNLFVSWSCLLCFLCSKMLNSSFCYLAECAKFLYCQYLTPIIIIIKSCSSCVYYGCQPNY